MTDSNGGRAAVDGNALKTTAVPFSYNTNPAPEIVVSAMRLSDSFTLSKKITLTILPIVNTNEHLVLPQTGDTAFYLAVLSEIPDGNDLTITIPEGFPVEFLIPSEE